MRKKKLLKFFFTDNVSALSLYKINRFDICNTVDFELFLLYHEVVKFRSNKTFGF